MAEENQDAQEKTEEATPKQRQDARDKGNVPRSRELSTMLVLMTGAAAMTLIGPRMAESLQSSFRVSMAVERELIFDAGQLPNVLSAVLLATVEAVLPFLVMIAAVAVIAPIAVGGWVFSTQSTQPQLGRMDPIKGIKRVFGPRGLVEMLKALAKFALILGCALAALYLQFDTIMQLGRGSVEGDSAVALDLLYRTFIAVSAATLVVALLDVPFQLWEYSKNLRMSHQQIKDEFKQTEGKPEVRSRIRQMQQEVASRRMMEEVPQADVIVTNPTHYAVALKYDPARDGAPTVVAKGADQLAQRIIEVGAAHGVMTMAVPPLARSLYHTTKLGAAIPAGLYVAVAQVIAYVFQLREGTLDASAVPPTDVPIPPDLAH